MENLLSKELGYNKAIWKNVQKRLESICLVKQ